MDWLKQNKRTVLLWGTVALAVVIILGALSQARAEGLSRKGVIAAETNLTSTAARWSGPWVAATLGYAVQSTDIEAVPNDLSLATKDLTYGGGAGWDHVFAGTSLLVGVGCDVDWTQAESLIAEWDRQWACWGRSGVLLTPALLAYVGAGHTELSGEFAAPVFGDERGLTVLGGLEALFKDGWFVRAEGRWVDLGGDDMGGVDVDSGQYAARVSLGYKFGAGK